MLFFSTPSFPNLISLRREFSNSFLLRLSPLPSLRSLTILLSLSYLSISRYRTGTFRPTVTVFEPFNKDLSSVVFGTDLRKWADGKGWKLPKDGEEMPSTLELVPSVLKALLEALETGYKGVEDVGGESIRSRFGGEGEGRELIEDFLFLFRATKDLGLRGKFNYVLLPR